MSIIRACSYQAAIKTPIDPSGYDRILVTFSQNDQIIVNKEKNQLDLQSDSVVVKLTQEETKLFTVPGMALLQIRAFKSSYEAPGSRIWPIQVYPALNDVILTSPAEQEATTT